MNTAASDTVPEYRLGSSKRWTRRRRAVFATALLPTLCLPVAGHADTLALQAVLEKHYHHVVIRRDATVVVWDHVEMHAPGALIEDIVEADQPRVVRVVYQRGDLRCDAVAMQASDLGFDGPAADQAALFAVELYHYTHGSHGTPANPTLAKFKALQTTGTFQPFDDAGMPGYIFQGIGAHSGDHGIMTAAAAHGFLLGRACYTASGIAPAIDGPALGIVTYRVVP